MDPFPVKPRSAAKAKTIYDRLNNLTEAARRAAYELSDDSRGFMKSFLIVGLELRSLADEIDGMNRDEGEED